MKSRRLDKYGLYQKVLNQSNEAKAKHDLTQIKTRKEITRELIEGAKGSYGYSKAKSGDEGKLQVYAICKNFLERSRIAKINLESEIPKVKFDDPYKAKRISIANNIKGDRNWII